MVGESAMKVKSSICRTSQQSLTFTTRRPMMSEKIAPRATLVIHCMASPCHSVNYEPSPSDVSLLANNELTAARFGMLILLCGEICLMTTVLQTS